MEDCFANNGNFSRLFLRVVVYQKATNLAAINNKRRTVYYRAPQHTWYKMVVITFAIILLRISATFYNTTNPGYCLATLQSVQGFNKPIRLCLGV